MKTFKKTQGMQIATRREGAIIGKFDDFQFDLETGRIYGYRVKAPGVFGKTGGLPADALLLLGRDLVLIASEASVEWAGEKRNSEDGRAWASRYLKNRAMTRRGALMGHVEDFVIEENPPAVRGLILDGSRLVQLDHRIAVGKDALILDDPSGAVALPPESAGESGEEGDWWRRVRDAFSRGDREAAKQEPKPEPKPEPKKPGPPGPDEE